MANTFVDPKTPGETKIYTRDWSSQLNSGATITNSSWVLSSTELTNVLDTIVAGNLKTSIKLSGGIEGSTYYCANTIVTSDSETLVRVGELKVQTEGVSA